MDLFSTPPRASADAKSGAYPRAPLATRIRPRSLEEYVGQSHILAPGKALRTLLEQGEVGNLILWGPPGTGKTTLARLVASATDRSFVPFSAVSEGVPRIREIAAEAETRIKATGRGTLVMIDEIHALNRSQQDVLLPFVESGLFTLVGATTEHVSFELNAALLSRCQVYRLQPLEADELVRLLERALADRDHGLGTRDLDAEHDALVLLAERADGDARRALTTLETAARLVEPGQTLTVKVAQEALAHRIARYDKGRDARYELLSALQKSVRNSDVQAALYYLARGIEGGEDGRVLLRRLAVMAAEDVGMADPQALPVVMAAVSNFEFVGPPEGWLAVAEAVVYLATAPKSNRSYKALGAARARARETMTAAVPDHLLNASTRMQREMGLGREYDYPFDHAAHVSPQPCLPKEIRGEAFYRPSEFGFEKKVAERLRWWQEKKAKGGPPDDASWDEEERGE